MDDDGPEVTTLVEDALHGRQQAWDSLVRRYAPLVIAVARQRELTRRETYEVAQVVWLRLVEKLADLREPGALTAWIRATTHEECRRHLGQTSHEGQGTAPERVAEPRGPVADQLVEAGRHAALLAALAELPDIQRELLILLTAIPPLPRAVISERLGIPVASIEPTRLRALKGLRHSPALATLRGGTQRERAGGEGHANVTLG
jgi:RNA polymerase sigma factor (sigma-70 family)